MIHQQAVDGGEVAAGNYIVAYAIERAEGFYEHKGSHMTYHSTEASTGENVHVEVSVRDAASGMFVPNLAIKATLFDANGTNLGTKDEPFMWHPWLYHYGENWRVPASGVYRLKIEIAAPLFRRHDVVNGVRYAQGVTAEFKNVRVVRGVK